MTAAELDGWVAFHKINPLDDRARIYKPMALCASAFGGEFKAAFEFLVPSTTPARPLKPVQVIRIPKE